MPLKILCDENIPNLVCRHLQERGFKVLRARSGSSDSQVAEMAKKQKALIVTHDSDFANILVYPPENYYGIIRLKFKPPLGEDVLNSLKKLFNKNTNAKNFYDKLIILQPFGVRVWDASKKLKPLK